MVLSDLVLGIFVRFGLLRLMFFRLFVFLFIWVLTPVHVMIVAVATRRRCGVFFRINSLGTLINVMLRRVILIWIDSPSVLDIMIGVVISRIIMRSVMKIIVPAKVIWSIRRVIIASLSGMNWEVVLAVLKEFRD